MNAINILETAIKMTYKVYIQKNFYGHGIKGIAIAVSKAKINLISKFWQTFSLSPKHLLIWQPK